MVRRLTFEEVKALDVADVQTHPMKPAPCPGIFTLEDRKLNTWLSKKFKTPEHLEWELRCRCADHFLVLVCGSHTPTRSYLRIKVERIETQRWLERITLRSSTKRRCYNILQT